VGCLVGPTLGGLFSDHLSWRWIFFVNVPIGLAAAAMLVRRFREDVTRTRHTIDYAGAVLLAGGACLLILGLLEGGVQWEWTSATSIAVIAAALLMLAAFVLVERRAAEPILPLWVFQRRVLNGANASSLVVGVLLIGLTSYVPLYSQGVLGSDALVGGFVVAAMTIGWPMSAALAGRFYLRIGFRSTALVGTAFAVAGAGLLLTVNGDSAIWHLAFACFVIGVGLGFIASPTLVAAQSSVDWATRGMVTGTNMFARSVGSALGIAAFGAIANAAIARRTTGDHPDLEHLPASVLEPSIHEVYVGAAIIAVVMVGAVSLLPGRDRTTRGADATATEILDG
jgi:MFS family permease